MFRKKTRTDEVGAADPYQEYGAASNPLEMLNIAADTGASLVKLFMAELRLTMNQMPRLLVLIAVLIPFVIFAWLGISVLVGWLAYVFSESVGWGIAAFTGLQLICCAAIGLFIKTSSSDVAFPASRRQFEKLFSGKE